MKSVSSGRMYVREREAREWTGRGKKMERELTERGEGRDNEMRGEGGDRERRGEGFGRERRREEEERRGEERRGEGRRGEGSRGEESVRRANIIASKTNTTAC